MLIAQVLFTVKPEQAQRFIRCTMENVRNSRQEPGVASFDFFKTKDVKDVDTSFMLFEQYKTAEDQRLHRETPHYKEWKANISDLLSEPYVVSTWEQIAIDAHDS